MSDRSTQGRHRLIMVPGIPVGWLQSAPPDEIKLRRSNHWTPSTFVQVPNGAGDEAGSRGPVRRTRPIQNLIDTPHLRYAMLTDTGSKKTSLLSEPPTRRVFDDDRLAAEVRRQRAAAVAVGPTPNSSGREATAAKPKCPARNGGWYASSVQFAQVGFCPSRRF